MAAHPQPPRTRTAGGARGETRRAADRRHPSSAATPATAAPPTRRRGAGSRTRISDSKRAVARGPRRGTAER
jgi:hypothetical protein